MGRTLSDHSNTYRGDDEPVKTRLKFLKRTRKKRSTVDVSSGTPLRASANADLTLDLSAIPWNEGSSRKSARKRLSQFFNSATQSERLPFGSPELPHDLVNSPPR